MLIENQTSETAEQAVNRFENMIAKLTRKYPKQWKQDLQQELRLVVLQLHAILQPGEDLKQFFVLGRFKRKITEFSQLERNKGMRKIPESADPIEYVNNSKYSITLTGDRILINNHV